MKILLLTEYGWPGNELATLLKSAENVELEIIHREDLDHEDYYLCDYDSILTFGPHYGWMIPLLHQVSRCMTDKNKPNLIWWMGENLPHFGTPIRNRIIGRLRSIADMLMYKSPFSFSRQHVLFRLAHRYRMLDALILGQKRGLFQLVATTSAYRGERLRELGIPCTYIPISWGPSNELGEQLELQRDIDVLWLGRDYRFRPQRQRNLSKLYERLEAKGIKVVKVSSGLSGDERTQLLNRTKILINLLRIEEDWTGHRLLLGAANGAMNISEPMVDTQMFVPNEHIIFSPLNDMPDVIEHYLIHESERRSITDKAFKLIHDELTMKQSLIQVFDNAGLPLIF